ncbi:glycosyltransferase family 92 protein RCOM_0530710-like isoform X2 [Vicia villosa]|nr:glycosyltransferase family 92 protein RCOM_0530710-like isoform X2 [Vicia villosa]
MDYYDESRSVARCPFHETNDSTSGGVKVVTLWRFGEVGRRNLGVLKKQTPQSWDRVAYEAMLDGDTVVVFVKGLNLRPHKISDPTSFCCHFGLRRFHKDGVGASFLLSTRVVSVAQEIVRCVLPQSVRNKPEKARGVRVTVSNLSGNLRRQVRTLLSSVARIGNGSVRKESSEKHELCVCSNMVWNQACALREWFVMLQMEIDADDVDAVELVDFCRAR